MKKLIFTSILVLGMAASGWATTYDLSAINLNLTNTDLAGFTGPYAIVTISGGSVDFAGQSITYGGHNFMFNLDQAALNTSNAPFAVSNLTSGFSVQYNGTDHQMDGFGKFNLVVGETGGANSAVSDISFLLGADPALLLNPDYDLAAHVFLFEQGATGGWFVVNTGFIGNGTSPPSVPEPGTLLLLGSGLLALGIFARRGMNH